MLYRGVPSMGSPMMGSSMRNSGINILHKNVEIFKYSEKVWLFLEREEK
jgi:hypothetical protein